MPLVTVNLMEGRSPEQLSAMILGVSEAVATALDAPLDSVRVVVHELQPHQYGVGGKAWPQVVADRRGAAEQDAS